MRAWHVFRLLYCILNNLYSIPAYLVWVAVLLPLKFINADLYWRYESKMFKWLLNMIASWQWSSGYDIIEYGEDISPSYDEECIVIVNHQSTADVPIIMQSLCAKGSCVDNVMWIMDDLFKFTNFGLVSLVRRDFFIRQGKEGREQQLKLLENHIVKHYWTKKRKWLIVFPEGGFLYKRLESSHRFAKKNNLPILNYVTLPRVGAMEVLLNIMTERKNERNGLISRKLPGKPLKWVIDITVGYPNNQPLDLIGIMAGSKPSCNTALYYKRYAAENIATDDAGLTKWMYDRFVEKEELLDTLYKTGKYPDNLIPSHPSTRMLTKPQKLEFSGLDFTLMHLFFFISTILHYKWISVVMGWIFL